MRRWLWLLPLVLLQACAGTPLAERLERSFAAPDEPVQPPATSPLPSQPEKTPISTEAPRATSMAESESESVARTEPEPSPKTESPTRVQAAPARPRQPLAPYRITIRLAEADPSAPAEAVTQSLRSSGVDFMVERVERVVP